MRVWPPRRAPQHTPYVRMPVHPRRPEPIPAGSRVVATDVQDDPEQVSAVLLAHFDAEHERTRP